MEKDNAPSLLNLIVLILSIYVLSALVASTVLKLTPETVKLLDYIDDIICIFFLLEFSIRFYTSKNKLRFMKWGWIDLISSIPTFNYLRAGRTLRLIKLLRILRALRSTKHLMSFVLKIRSKEPLQWYQLLQF